MADVPPGSTVYTCSYSGCDKFFRKRDRLLIHFRSHTGERPFICEHENCGKCYVRGAHLKRHVESVHCQPKEENSRKSSSYVCPYHDCGVNLSSQSSLNKHVIRFHKDPKYVCQFEGCGKKCKSNKHLRKHERDNHSIDQLICSHDGCGREFISMAKLRAHLKTHEGYRCTHDGCEEIFPAFSLLRKHLSVSHNVLECKQCHKRFVSKTNLKMHMKIHREERPVFECPRDNCGRVYLDTRNLNAHIRSYHDGKRVQCTQHDCTQTFSCKNKMLLHLPLHDPNKALPKKKLKKKDKLKKRKKRNRPKPKPNPIPSNMAETMSGVTDLRESGAHFSVYETDEDDRVVYSGSDSDIGCRLKSRVDSLLVPHAIGEAGKDIKAKNVDSECLQHGISSEDIRNTLDIENSVILCPETSDHHRTLSDRIVQRFAPKICDSQGHAKENLCLDSIEPMDSVEIQVVRSSMSVPSACTVSSSSPLEVKPTQTSESDFCAAASKDPDADFPGDATSGSKNLCDAKIPFSHSHVPDTSISIDDFEMADQLPIQFSQSCENRNVIYYGKYQQAVKKVDIANTTCSTADITEDSSNCSDKNSPTAGDSPSVPENGTIDDNIDIADEAEGKKEAIQVYNIFLPPSDSYKLEETTVILDLPPYSSEPVNCTVSRTISEQKDAVLLSDISVLTTENNNDNQTSNNNNDNLTSSSATAHEMVGNHGDSVYKKRKLEPEC